MTTTAQPLVTVVMASYNHRAYIEKAIQSIVTQDYQPLELLIIDDGSPDGSGDYLESLQPRYGFRLIRRANGGLVSVLNLGIREAKGDYIVFHASDDESLPGRISGQVHVLQRHPQAAFVSGNVAYLTEDGRDRGTMLPVTGHERELGFDDIYLGRAQLSSVASMYRASALREMGQLDEKYRAEDPQIFFRLTRPGHTWVQWAGQPVITYRMLFTSMSRTIMPLLLRQHLQLLNEYADHPQHATVYADLKAKLLSTLAEQDKKEALALLAEGGFNYFTGNFLRALVKLLLPHRLHYLFKTAGKPAA